jgi:acyl carrier protein
MTIQAIDLQPLFREVLENESLIITNTTKAADIDEWDSLNHIYLIVAIEEQFKIKFKTSEIQSWLCVGDIINAINTKLQ